MRHFFVVAMIVLPIVWAGAARAEDCALKRLAELPIIENETNRPIVSVLVDAQPRRMLIDTGGFWSLLNPAIAANYRVWGSEVQGDAGLRDIRLNRAVRAPSVQIGPLKVDNVEFFLAPAGYLDVDGTFGANWLRAFDLEIDPIEGKVSLFLQKHCEGKVVYWPFHNVAVLPLRFDISQSLITLPMTLDGEEVRAVIDTGSSDTILSLRAARRLFKLQPDSPGVERARDEGGNTDQDDQPTYRHKFNSLEMDGIVFKNPTLTLSAMRDTDADLILGMRELRGLHLYFAYGEKKLYATSTRDEIAARRELTGDAALPPRTDPLDRANARDLLRQAIVAVQNNDLGSATADLNQAIQLDPNNAAAYTARARIHFTKGERDQAFRDIDEAMRRDPAYADAYLQRSHFYRHEGDIEHALADADQLVVLAPKSVVALNNRCWLRVVIARDLDGALADCDAALQIAPSDPDTLDSHATALLKAGRFDEAFADYNAALVRKPQMASSIYGRGLAKRKKGDIAGGDADVAAAVAIDPDIARHFGK